MAEVQLLPLEVAGAPASQAHQRGLDQRCVLEIGAARSVRAENFMWISPLSSCNLTWKPVPPPAVCPPHNVPLDAVNPGVRAAPVEGVVKDTDQKCKRCLCQNGCGGGLGGPLGRQDNTGAVLHLPSQQLTPPPQNISGRPAATATTAPRGGARCHHAAYTCRSASWTLDDETTSTTS